MDNIKKELLVMLMVLVISLAFIFAVIPKNVLKLSLSNGEGMFLTAIPRNPHPVYGYVYLSDGITSQLNASVTLINLNTSDQISTTTERDGSYTIDLSNLDYGYTVGDPLNISAYHGRFIASITVTVTDEPYQQVDLILSGIVEAYTPKENLTAEESKTIVNTENSSHIQINLNVTLPIHVHGIVYIEINVSEELNNTMKEVGVEVAYNEEEVKEVDTALTVRTPQRLNNSLF